MDYQQAESDPTLEPQSMDKQRTITEKQNEVSGMESSKREAEHEQRAIQLRIQRLRSQISEAGSVQKQKFEVLKNMRQGQEAAKAAVWLQNNRDQFKGK